jgi:tetratricopeptide (TPR) repeat protein
VTAHPPQAPYTLRSIQALLGVSRGVVMALVDAGFVAPSRGARNEYRFSFRDLVLLRTAHGLRCAQVPPRRIVRSLKRLMAQLPEDLPLTGLRVTAEGDSVAVHERGARWNAESGQLLLDFELAMAGGQLVVTQRQADAAPSSREPDDAVRWFKRGEDLESTDPGGAEAAYRRVIAIATDHAAAYANLSALLCEAGRCAEAVELLDAAILHCPDDAVLHYNRAIALEDEGHPWDALRAYERSLAVQPGQSDAHFNAARLAEQLGETQQALRHLNAYRRLSRSTSR